MVLIGTIFVSFTTIKLFGMSYQPERYASGCDQYNAKGGKNQVPKSALNDDILFDLPETHWRQFTLHA